MPPQTPRTPRVRNEPIDVPVVPGARGGLYVYEPDLGHELPQFVDDLDDDARVAVGLARRPARPAAPVAPADAAVADLTLEPAPLAPEA